MPSLGDALQWTGVVVSSATCFIAAALSFFVFQEQRRASAELLSMLARLAASEREQRNARQRDEFHRWVLLQVISLQEETIFLIESFVSEQSIPTNTKKRLTETRETMGRTLYELKVFSGDERTIKVATRQLIGIYPDIQTLEVVRLASEALSDLAVASWLADRVTELERKLYPPSIIASRRWTGRTE